MEEFKVDVYDSIEKYFNTLSTTGYKSYSEVNKLLVMIFIEELLYGPLSQYITEDDYNTIIKAMYCFYGSCMISYPTYKREVDKVANTLLKEFRITEDNILRQTESNSLRTIF